MLARRKERIDAAASEAGPNAFAVVCDVTDESSCRSAIDEAATRLGGIDALVYAPAIGPLARLVDVDTDTWRQVFDTNVIGAARITAAAIPHLEASRGIAAFMSSRSASLTPPWPGLGAYIVSKAALDKLVQAWRVEHLTVGFTNLVVGDCAGGEGDSMTGFTEGWDTELATELGTDWFARGYISGSLIEIDELVSVVDSVLRSGSSLSLETVSITPRVAPIDPI